MRLPIYAIAVGTLIVAIAAALSSFVPVIFVALARWP